MPQNSYCKDFEWRLRLDVGDQIDISDSNNVWYNGTVLKREVTLEEETGIEIPRLFVAYRIFHIPQETANLARPKKDEKEVETKAAVGH